MVRGLILFGNASVYALSRPVIDALQAIDPTIYRPMKKARKTLAFRALLGGNVVNAGD